MVSKVIQMNDAMDSAMDNVDDEQEADKVYSQICGEIGIDIDSEMGVNQKPIAVQNNAPVSVN